MDNLFMFFAEGWRVVCCFIILDLHSIIWIDVQVELILWLAGLFVT